jgi:hypothetical protein
MIGLVALGLLLSGVTIWPMEWELSTAIRLLWGSAPASDGTVHAFLLRVLDAWRTTARDTPFLLYGFDWLAYAHLMLAVLFAMVLKDPVRNVLVLRFGLVCCACVPILAGACIPLRGIPLPWFLLDASFAPACALPLWIALRDVRRLEPPQ